ncbi:MAG TPA: nucleotide exchange factor GrpE [Micromonosporaceae bacterium]
MTDNSRKAGSGDKPGPAREQVVIRDKRKIDASGRAKNGTEQAEQAPAEDSAAAESASAGQAQATQAGANQAEANQAGAAQAKADSGPAATGSDAGKAGDNNPAAMGQPGTPVADGGATRAATGAGATTTTSAEPAAAGGDGAGASAEVREPAAAGTGLGAELEALRGELDERTRDLQRVNAEYANYRKRVERDRALVGEQAVGSVISALLPILDDLDRAREHGDLVGPFAAVADQLTAALTKFGLTGFGEQGDPFDPTRHEAVAHQTSAEVTEPTCVSVMRRGYLLGERLLRPAMVAVADPE